MAHGLRVLIRATDDRGEGSGAAIADARTSQGTPGSGGRAGLDGHEKKNGSKAHVAVAAPGSLLGSTVGAANEPERNRAETLARKAQDVADGRAEVIFADRGCTGEPVAGRVAAHGVEPIAVKPKEAGRGSVLLPGRRVVERTFGWPGRFRRLARGYGRLEQALAGWHRLAALMPMASRLSQP